MGGISVDLWKPATFSPEGSIVVAGTMVPEEPELPLRRFADYFGIKLKAVQVGREFLGDHSDGVMDLQQVTRLAAGIRGAAVPDFASEDNDVARFAEN